jgi:hypothetical protein
MAHIPQVRAKEKENMFFSPVEVEKRGNISTGRRSKWKNNRSYHATCHYYSTITYFGYVFIQVVLGAKGLL